MDGLSDHFSFHYVYLDGSSRERLLGGHAGEITDSLFDEG